MKHSTKSLVMTLLLLAAVVGMSSCHKQYLRGYYTWDEFRQQAEWKCFVDEKYKPSERWMDSLRGLHLKDSMDLEIFLGTYCKDSKKWVPRFFAIQEEMPIRNIHIISLDTTKKDEKGIAPARGVKKIPTFIFYKNQQEIGRIVEKPKGGLEKSLYQLLKKM